MNPNHITVEEAALEASQKTSTANELDIVVSKTREINNKRDRTIREMETLLEDIERQLIHN